uniref:Secreted protein n=1 Tax=Trypanosoma vivax (strain Y486) TaxID=1055687 RepID=G0UBZ8_TRYVY|nr:hypothetical protein TVY486_1108300 [Trypanosoma vivax Y486]
MCPFSICLCTFIFNTGARAQDVFLGCSQRSKEDEKVAISSEFRLLHWRRLYVPPCTHPLHYFLLMYPTGMPLSGLALHTSSVLPPLPTKIGGWMHQKPPLLISVICERTPSSCIRKSSSNNK